MGGVGCVEVFLQQVVQFFFGLRHGRCMDGPPIVEVLQESSMMYVEDISGKAMRKVFIVVLSILIGGR